MRGTGLILATSLLLMAASAAADPAGDWPTYGHDKGGQRFSPLTQITPSNVGRLKAAWVYHMRPPADPNQTPAEAEAAQRAAEAAGPPRRRRSRFAGSQATPLVIDGRMFLTTPYGRVVALDPATGRELWVAPIEGPGQPSQRGLEYWPGDAATPARLLFGTRDGRLFALDAETGRRSAGFGANGMVDMKTPEVMGDGDARFYGMTSPPIVFGDLVITGSAVQEFPARGAAGDVRAWNVRTGALVWTFHSVPRRGEPGYQSWAPGSAEGRSGVNAWGFMTVDEARGIVYMPFGAPTFDRYGGDRAGDNLYGTSLVAADARTGRYLWHFQVVHHDIWDNDLEAPPLLFDATVDGRTVPAVAIVSKNGLLFVLDRVTGRPIHPVEERPFPASDVPGEAASPTQPIPVLTPPLARTSFALNEIADVTPQLRSWCENWVREHDMRAGGLYVPVGLNRVTISFPGLQGGANWGGAAYDPRSGLLFVNTNDLGQVTSLVPSDGPLPYQRGPVSDRFQMDEPRMMCQQPPWGRLSAVDTRTGRIAWQVPLGVTDGLPEGRQRTGRPNIGGAIATASGLLFIGATDDGRFRAFDSATGAELWSHRLEAAAHATPATYLGSDGRQYVVVTSTGGSFLDSPLASDTVTAFALETGQ
jgi:quinoprotein glucose dehydrogenase